MKKITLLILFFSFYSYTTFAQNKVSGVVTYFFNKYQGDKADLGAEVYLIPKDSINEVDFQLIKDVTKLNSLNSKLSVFTLPTKMETKNYEYYKKQKQKLESKDKTNSEKYKYAYEYVENYELKNTMREKTLTEIKTIESKYDIENIESKAYQNYVIATIKASQKTVVDATGSYNLDCDNGDYYVIIKSKNRKRTNMLEMQGQNYFDIITVNKNINISHNFGLYD